MYKKMAESVGIDMTKFDIVLTDDKVEHTYFVKSFPISWADCCDKPIDECKCKPINHHIWTGKVTNK